MGPEEIKPMDPYKPEPCPPALLAMAGRQEQAGGSDADPDEIATATKAEVREIRERARVAREQRERRAQVRGSRAQRTRVKRKIQYRERGKR